MIIGAGVVGTAIARALGRVRARLRAARRGGRRRHRHDEGEHRDPAHRVRRHARHPGEPARHAAAARCCATTRRQAGIPVERTGALLVAWTAEQAAALPCHRRTTRGATDIRRSVRCPRPICTAASRTSGRAPWPPWRYRTRAIICPWTTPLAFATEAVRAGVRLRLGTRVTGVNGPARTAACIQLATARGPCAPLAGQRGRGERRIDRMFGGGGFTIRPRRGELIVFDKLARPLVRSILLPVPTARTKGVLVALTVYGNVLLGPTAEDIDRSRDTATTAAGLGSLLAARAADPARAWTRRRSPRRTPGCGPPPSTRDYQIEVDAHGRYVCVAGIRSTGLTASLGIAEHVVDRARRGRAWPLRGAARRSAGAAGDAVHRRGRAAAVPGRRADRRRPGLRRDRLPLRAGRPAARSGTRWPARCRPPTSTDCAAGPAP